MNEADYRGYISLEFEGKASALPAIGESLAMLRQHFSV